MRLIMRLTLATIAVLAGHGVHAETDRIRVGPQYGLPYMQLILMQDRDFRTARAKEPGVPALKIAFVNVSGPAMINDSLISGALDVGACGSSSLITLWDKTRGSNNARRLVGMNVMPLLLVSRDPRITTVADYGPDDRIALPATKVAAKAFGNVEFTLQPNGLLATAAFMAKTGMIKQHPTSWKDMYFDTVPGGEGS
jgi:NitT/TauT family transport system substrate-binding protein